MSFIARNVNFYYDDYVLKIKFFWVLVFLVFELMTPITVDAGGFNLKQIGEVSTDGKQISHWWYSGSQPVLRGEASPGAEITISVDGNSQMINSDSSGFFNYQIPTALAPGDHQVELSSQGSTISFTLTTGVDNVNWEAVDRGSGEALPAAGWPIPTVLMTISGIGLPFLGKRLWK